MSRPKIIKVLGKSYKMEWDSQALDGCAGDHSQQLLTIRVAPRQAPDEERETLLHELTHAVENQLGLTMPERKVRALSVGLYAVLKDNPTLRRYLWGK